MLETKTTTEDYLRKKKTLQGVMKKLTIEELQEIALHPHQAYIFFDCAIDCLLAKMRPMDFQDFVQDLYNARQL